MAFASSKPSNSRSIINLATCPSQNPPTDSADEAIKEFAHLANGPHGITPSQVDYRAAGNRLLSNGGESHAGGSWGMRNWMIHFKMVSMPGFIA